VQAGEDTGFVSAGEFVLPDAEDTPTGAERAGDEAVAGGVGLDRVAPKGGVGFRLRGVERTTVPEAAFDEDGEVVRPGK
jgi:hypothetical protein